MATDLSSFDGSANLLKSAGSPVVEPSIVVGNGTTATPHLRRPVRVRPNSGRLPEVVSPQHAANEVGPDKASPWSGGLDWTVVISIVTVHTLALGALWFFTWKALAIAAVLSWCTGGLGICLGFHRMLTHGSFQTYRPVRWLLALIGTFSGQGSAITWVANHRKHHAHSDKPGDPHSPHDGPWWSHMLWFTPNFGQAWHKELSTKYAPDLLKDPVIRFLHWAFLPLQFALGFALFAIGWIGWDAYTGWSFVFWGIFARMVYVWHITWLVNSATHIWGYRNYATSDDSRNLWWVGLFAFGEGWHNNHHAFQRMARHGHKWWEVDVTYWAICVLERLGLAWNVVHSVPAHQKPE